MSYANNPREHPLTKVFTNLFLYLLGHGKLSQWTLLLDSHGQNKGMTNFLWLWTILAKWHTSYHARALMMHHILHNYSSKKLLESMVFLSPLCQTGMPSFKVTFGEPCIKSWVHIYNLVLPIIHKWMGR